MSARDASGDGFTGGVGGSEEEAAWRDLIARYEMQADRGAGDLPWPEREDLPDAEAPPGSHTDGSGTGTGTGTDVNDADGTGTDGTGTDRTGTDGGDGGLTPAADNADDSDATDGGDNNDRPAGQGAWFGRTRVIRPAIPPTAPSPPGTSPPPGGPQPPDDAGTAAGQAGTAGSHTDAGTDSRSGTGAADRTYITGYITRRGGTSQRRGGAGHPGRAAGHPGAPGKPDQPGDPDLPGSVLDEEDDPEEHYIPPPPPPLPHLDPVAKGAWTALFGGPAYLLVSTLIGQSPPAWAALLAVAAFIGGFAVVVLRLGDKPSRGDGPDNGAVV